MFKRQNKLSLNNKGLTLVELMITIAIVSIGGYVFATQMYNINQNMEMIKRKSALEELKGNIRILALNRTAITHSATLPANAGIKDCILGTAKCVPGPAMDFTLALPNSAPVASSTSFYNYQGVSCPAWNESCPIKVSSMAKAVCNRGAPQCIYAGGVYLVTSIEILPAVAAKVASYGLRDSMETSLLPLSGTNEGNKALKDMDCPAGKVLRGVDLVNNKAICWPES